MGSGFSISFADIEAAAQTIEGHVLKTPLMPAPRLSALTGAQVFVKHENMQATASFKERGAVNKLRSLTDEEKRRGVIAMSAGNHAQAVAYHAKRFGIPATIVMPETTPLVKVENTRAHGAEVVLFGETLSESAQKAREIAAEKSLVFVHPYDDAAVMAGQGTVALEMLREEPDLDMLLIPLGGGGLMAGNAVAAKTLKPSIELIGIEAALYPSFHNALHGAQMPIGGATLAEGIAVKTVGTQTLPVVKELVSDIVLVGEDLIERAVNACATLQHTLAEGAGAAGLAAMLKEPERYRGRKVGLVLSGGNIEPLVLAEIIERGMVKSGRLARLRFDVRDVPGALANVATLLGKLGANIDEVQHQRAFTSLSVERAQIEVVVQTRGVAHIAEILAAMRAEGYKAERVG